MNTIINKSNKLATISTIANDMDSNKFNRLYGMNELYSVYIVKKNGVDVYERGG